ncbi:helix-turn-helix domain-containing protein [Chitinophaga lutea]
MANDKEKILRELGSRIQKMRLEKGYSTRVFAYRADIAHSTVEKLESGEMNPSFIVLLKLAEALEVDLKMLTGY